VTHKRVQFDFEIDFVNGGGLQGQGFRLDIDGDDIGDRELGEYLARDLRLLMVGAVRIRNKRIIEERHKRGAAAATGEGAPRRRIVDLSHPIEDGMITYKGLPGPTIGEHLTREASSRLYAEGTEFSIGRIELVGNTGTYLDSPFHRYADGQDLAELDLAVMADLEGVVARVVGMEGQSIPAAVFVPLGVRGKAVLIHTGWAVHWRMERYAQGHPFLSEEAAGYLVQAGATLVGIDSFNIDDVEGGRRPAHSGLLRAGIPIVEHLRGLEQLPAGGFRFSAVPAPVRGMSTLPVRAYAVLDA
jgi:kynurenine formamidase